MPSKYTRKHQETPGNRTPNRSVVPCHRLEESITSVLSKEFSLVRYREDSCVDKMEDYTDSTKLQHETQFLSIPVR